MAFGKDTPALKVEGTTKDLEILLSGSARGRIESDILPQYVLAQRWYGAKDSGLPDVVIADAITFMADATSALLVTLSVTPPAGAVQSYFLPLMLVSENDEPLPGSACIARLESGPSVTWLVDALATDAFGRAMIEGIRSAAPDAASQDGLSFKRTDALTDIEASLRHDRPVERSEAEQSNTSLRIGGAMLKAFRKLEAGVHPEVEISAFLTEQGQFDNVPAFLGSVERVRHNGERVSLCVLQALVPNQGDGWNFALARLAEAPGDPDAAEALNRLADRLGRCTAELHHAFAAPTQNDAFAAERLENYHLVFWSSEVSRQARAALEGLGRVRSDLHPRRGRRLRNF